MRARHRTRHSQVAQGRPIGRPSFVAERGHDRGVDAAVVQHPEGLEVVLERMSDHDRVRVDERVEGAAHGGQSEHGRRVELGCHAGETRVEVAVGAFMSAEFRKSEEVDRGIART